MTQPSLLENTDIAGAVFDPSERYRYRLWRQWGDGGTVTFVMLNPSTATADVLDPTVRKCVGFARRWGYGRLEVVNLFAWRATDPKELPKCTEPIGADNDAAILAACQQADLVVCAWSSEKVATARGRRVREMLTGAGIALRALRLSKDGHPWHPLYVPYDVALIDFRP